MKLHYPLIVLSAFIVSAGIYSVLMGNLKDDQAEIICRKPGLDFPCRLYRRGVISLWELKREAER